MRAGLGKRRRFVRARAERGLPVRSDDPTSSRWAGRGLALAFVVVLGLAGTAHAADVAPPGSGAAGPQSGNVMGPSYLDREISQLEPTARDRWPGSFAGLWISPGSPPRHVYIAFTEGAEEKVAEIATKFSKPELLVPVDAKHSLAHLEAVKREMVSDREAARGAANPLDGLRGARYDLGIDVQDNVVEAVVPGDLEEARASVTRAYGSKRNASTDEVRVIQAGLARPLACADRFHCGLQLRAGTGTVFQSMNGGYSSCTLGFSVNRPGTYPQILSAAHCGDGDNGTPNDKTDDVPDIGNSRYHRTFGGSGAIPANLFGSVHAQVHSGRVDAERLSVGNGFSANPWVYLTQDVQASPVWSVGTWATLPIGAKLCKAGTGTGYQCGIVVDKDYSPGYIPNGNRFLALQPATPQDSPLSAGGDSGAPFVSYGTQAEALLSGGGGGQCGCYTLAGHIQYADEALGVSPRIDPTPHWTIDNLGGNISSDPDVSSWGYGRLDFFARGANNDLQHRYYNGNYSGWESLGGNLASGPGAVSWGPNRIDVVARATNNTITHWAWNGSGWYVDNLGGNISSDPDVNDFALFIDQKALS